MTDMVNTGCDRSVPAQHDVFYGQPDSERLLHRSLADAIEEYCDEADCMADVPLVIPMAEFSRMRVNNIRLYEPLEQLIEQLEDEYGDWEGAREIITPRMKEAEEVFLKVVHEEYVPYGCEATCRFFLLSVQPAGECCTFVTGCCLGHKEKEMCGFHSLELRQTAEFSHRIAESFRLDLKPIDHQ